MIGLLAHDLMRRAGARASTGHVSCARLPSCSATIIFLSGTFTRRECSGARLLRCLLLLLALTMMTMFLVRRSRDVRS